MKDDMSPSQALFLWQLLTAETASGREPLASKAAPKRDREQLLDEGYLTTETRGSAKYLVLTDKAWAWAAAAHDVEFPAAAGAEALQGLLRRLLPFLQQNDIPLASLFSHDAELMAAAATPAPPKTRVSKKKAGKKASKKKTAKKKAAKKAATKKASKKTTSKKAAKKKTGKKSATQAPVEPKSAKASSPNRGDANDPSSQTERPSVAPDTRVSLSERIETACLELAHGQRQQRVRLSALRAELADVSRSALDQALLYLQDLGRAVLYRDDNTAALTAADHEAALIVGNAPRHLVYLEA